MSKLEIKNYTMKRENDVIEIGKSKDVVLHIFFFCCEAIEIQVNIIHCTFPFYRFQNNKIHI